MLEYLQHVVPFSYSLYLGGLYWLSETLLVCSVQHKRLSCCCPTLALQRVREWQRMIWTGFDVLYTVYLSREFRQGESNRGAFLWTYSLWGHRCGIYNALRMWSMRKCWCLFPHSLCPLRPHESAKLVDVCNYNTVTWSTGEQGC